MKKLLLVLSCCTLVACQDDIYGEGGGYEEENPYVQYEKGGFQEDRPVYEPTDPEDQKLIKYSYECKASNKLSDDIFHEMGKKLERKEDIGCYHECYYKKSGDMTPDGIFVKDVMIQKMPIWLIDWCINDVNVVNTMDDCTRAYEMYKCVRRPLMTIMKLDYEDDK